MLTLPVEPLPLIVELAPLLSKPVWEPAKTLIVGAILAIGKCDLTACMRVTVKNEEFQFQNYHRVLNQARWSAIEVAKAHMPVTPLAPNGDGKRSKPRGSTAIRFVPRTRTMSGFCERQPLCHARFALPRERHAADQEVKPVRAASWYERQTPRLADATAIVRRCFCGICRFSTSSNNSDVLKALRSLLERITYVVCYATLLISFRSQFCLCDDAWDSPSNLESAGTASPSFFRGTS